MGKSGKRVRVLAVVLFVLTIISSIGSGITLWIVLPEHGFLFFLLASVGGIFSGWVIYVIWDALGVAAEKSELAFEEICELRKELSAAGVVSSSETTADAAAQSAAAAQVFRGCDTVPSYPKYPKSSKPAVKTNPMELYPCPRCGTKNAASREFCIKCGERLS